MPRTGRRTRTRLALAVEPLEGRQLLARGPIPPVVVPARFGGNPGDGSGLPAILAALRGGPGNEFITLVRQQGVNVNRVLAQFVLGLRSEFAVDGFAIKTPKFQPLYRGPQLDQFNPTASGAVLLKTGTLELGAILRGPIDRPEPVSYVWGIDRGAGAADPEGLGLPGLKYDAIVRVDRAGPAVSARVIDLRTGAETPLTASAVKIEGPTIRVFLPDPARLLPSTGAALRGYRYAFFTRSGPGGIAAVGGFVPSGGSIPIGVLNGAVPRGARR